MVQEKEKKQPKRTDWALYEYCDACEGTAGEPCADLRYGRRTHFNANWPHRGRERRMERA